MRLIRFLHLAFALGQAPPGYGATLEVVCSQQMKQSLTGKWTSFRLCPLSYVDGMLGAVIHPKTIDSCLCAGICARLSERRTSRSMMLNHQAVLHVPGTTKLWLMSWPNFLAHSHPTRRAGAVVALRYAVQFIKHWKSGALPNEKGQRPTGPKRRGK